MGVVGHSSKGFCCLGGGFRPTSRIQELPPEMDSQAQVMVAGSSCSVGELLLLMANPP